jgi:hypothetical protein
VGVCCGVCVRQVVGQENRGPVGGCWRVVPGMGAEGGTGHTLSCRPYGLIASLSSCCPVCYAAGCGCFNSAADSGGV